MPASRLTALLMAAVSLSGCISQQVNQRSNAVEYLYAAGAEARPATTLRLVRPVRVGLAFAPSEGAFKETFSAEQKQALLEAVAARFRARPGIEAIEIIPATALTPRGGFAELDRIRASFRVGQIVLVSYDQVQFANSGALSLTYWVTYGAGAYVIKGEKNETRTLMDAVVYDIGSRTMLFHAVGQSSIKGSSTLMEVGKALRKRSAQGFAEATTDLVEDLAVNLDRFVTTIVNDEVRVEAAPAIPAATTPR